MMYQQMELKEMVNEEDPLYEQARKAVIRYDKASTGLLQRVFQISFTRAEKLIDELEKNGVIGPHRPGKPRKVLVEE